MPEVSALPHTKPRQVRKILMKDFQEAEYAFARFSVILPVGCEIEDALQPEFWSNVSHLLQSHPVSRAPAKTGAVIELRTQDHKFYAELYVRAVLEQGLIVSLLRDPVAFGPKKKDNGNGTPPAYLLRWNVGHRGFDILRASDDAIVGRAQDFPIKEKALDWIEEMNKQNGNKT